MPQKLNIDPAPQAAQRPNRERYDFEEKWPANVWSIGVGRIDLIGVDEQGELYWDGRRIEVRRGISLSFWQRAGAIVVALATICAATGTCITAYTDWVSMPKAGTKADPKACTPPPRSK